MDDMNLKNSLGIVRDKTNIFKRLRIVAKRK
jgi:hypothetical protein